MTNRRKSRRDLLAEQLDVRQQRAVYILLDNEMLSRTDPEYKTQETIAKEVGVDRATLYRWRKQNQAFIEFKKEVAKDYLGDAVGVFASQLISSMRGKQPSQRALDLYAKMMGFITNDHKVEVSQGSAQSDEDLTNELAALDAQLAELDEDNRGDED